MRFRTQEELITSDGPTEVLISSLKQSMFTEGELTMYIPHESG